MSENSFQKTESDIQTLSSRIRELEAENYSLKAQSNRFPQYPEAYRHFYEESEDPICICDLDGRISGANEAFLRITGWESSKLPDIALISLLHPDDIEKAKEAFLNCANNQPSKRLEIRLRTKAERYVTISLNLFPYRENKVIEAVWCVGKDITNYRRTDSALKQSRSFLNSVLENAPFPIYVVSKSQHLLTANALCDQTLGFPISRMQGQKISSIFPESTYADLYDANIQIIESKEPRSVEVTAEFAGKIKHFVIHKFPLIDDSGDCDAIWNLMLDVTENKKQEEASRHKATFLSGIVGLTNATDVARRTFEYIRKSYPCDSGLLLVTKGSADPRVEVLYSFDTSIDGMVESEEARDVWELDSQSYSAKVLESGQILIVRRDEAELFDLHPTNPDTLAFNNRPSRTLLYIPLKIQGRKIGVISLQSYKPDAFTDDDMSIFESIVSAAALAIDSAKASEIMEESEQRYKAIWENSPIGICLTDKEGVYKYVNPAICEMYGLNREDIIGKFNHEVTLGKFESDNNLNSYSEIFQAGEAITATEYEFLRHDGKTIWVEVSANFIRKKGNPHLMLWMVKEITDKKLTEQKIAISEERFRLLFENAPDIIYFTDLEGRVVDANQTASKAIGYDKEAAIGKKISELGIFDAEESKRIELAFETLQPGVEFGPQTFSFIRNDGQKFVLEARVYPVQIDNKVLVMGIARDIGERIKAEEALRQSEERFAAAFKASPAALSLSRLEDGCFIAANDNFIAITGYAREELLGNSSVVLGLYPNPSLRDEFIQVLANNGVIKNYEMEIRDKTGKIKNVLFSTEVVELNSDKLMLATMVDITERKQSEKTIIRSENIARSLHSTFVKMNKCTDMLQAMEPLLHAAIDISGTEGGGIYLIENDVAKLCIHKGLPQLFIDAVRSVPMDAEFVREVLGSDNNLNSIMKLPIIDDLGGRFGIKHAYSIPLRTSDGQPIGFMNLATTQTEEPEKRNLDALAILAQEAETLFLRIKTEQALHASEERYRRIVENATEGIWALDRDLKTSFVNPKMALILGYTPEEMMGVPISEFIFSEDIDDHQIHMDLRRRGGDDNYYRRFRSKDGNARWCNVSATSLKDSNGEFAGTFAMFTDITERRNMEIALAESERKFREMAERINDVLFVVNASGNVTYVSPSCATVFGWQPDEMIDKPFNSFIHESADALPSIETPESFKNLELLLKRKDGTAFSGELNATIRLEAGRFAGTIAVMRDISQRKIAEKSLRERESKLSSIFRATPVGIGVVVDRVIKEANERLSAITGYSREELIDMPARVLYLTEEEYQYVGKEKYRQIKEVGIGSVETRWKRKDGTTIEILLSSCPVNPADYSLGVTFSAQDISERKETERELRESEERFRRLVETAPDGIIIQTHGQFVYANNEAIRILGVSDASELIGQSIIEHFHPNYRQRVMERIHKIIVNKESVPLLEEEILRADGTTVPIEATAIPFAFEGSQGALVFMRDITQRITAEKALRESRERLTEAQRIGKIGNWEYVIDTKEHYWSEELYRIFERDPSQGPENYLEQVKYTSREEFQRIIDGINRAIDSHEESNVALECNLPSGKEIYLNITIRFACDDNGKLIKLFGTVQDITEHRKTVEALRVSEEFNRAIIEHSPLGVSVRARDGRLLSYNTAWLNIWRKKEFPPTYPLDGPRGSLIYNRHDDYLGEWKPKVKAVYEKGGYLLIPEVKLLRQEEPSRWLSQHFYALKDQNGQVERVVVLTEDISERKRAEEALRDNEQRYRGLFEGAWDAIFIADAETGIILDANAAASRLMECSIEQLIGMHQTRLHPVEQAAHYKEVFSRLAESLRNDNTISATEIRDMEVMTFKGKRVPVEISTSNIILPNGKKVVQGIFRDITERKQTEAVLEQEAIRRKVFIEKSKDGIVVLEESGKVLEANEKYCTMLGYTPEEILNLHVWDWDRKWNQDQLLETLRAIGPEGDQFETQHTRKDGSVYDADISINGVTVGGRKLIFCVSRDITERKIAEAALRDSEERFRAVFENATIGIYRTTPDGRIIMANPGLLQMLGYNTFEELAQRNLETAGFEREYSRSTFKKLMERVGIVFGLESQWKKADGNSIFVRESAKAIRDKEGSILFYEGTVEDITETKKATEALMASEERYRLLIENATDAILVSRDSRIIFSNKRIAEFLGYSDEVIKSPDFFNFIHPDDLKLVKERQKARLDGENPPNNYEIRATANDGTIKWLQISSLRIIWDGTPAILSFATDITERKIAEEAVRENEAKFRSLFENSADALLLLGDVFIDCNERACELFGYTRDELIGISPWEVSPAFQADGLESVAKANTYINKAFGGDSQFFYWQHMRKDKSIIDCEVTLKVITIGNKKVLHSTVRDIGQRMRSEEAMKRLATAVEQSADGIFITNPVALIQYVNPAFELITGFSREDAIGQSTRILKSDKQDKSFYEVMWNTLLKGGTWSGQLINRKKDGSYYNEVLTVSPVYDASGKLINFVAIMRDVTKQVALEQMFNQSQKMEAVGRLAGGVAHDFNNLLTAIMGYSEFLLNKIPLDSQLYADVIEIKKAGERAADLTRQLLAFSRKQMIQPKALNLNNIVADMNKMLKRLIGEDVQLIIMPSESLWQVKADPGQVEQVIMNLAINARDAMPDGGKLVIETANMKIKDRKSAPIPTMKHGDYIMLAIHDSGTGITAEVKEHIFEPFFTTKELGKGTGLGLATVYAIIEQNEGYIECDSEPGRGTSFKIYLPKLANPVSRSQTGQIPNLIIGGSETILVVEDEEIVRNLACRILRDAGYNILAATGPIEAVKICENYHDRIDMVLTDVVMPEMNGIALVAQLKDRYPKLKAMMMSGYMDSTFLNDHVAASNEIIQKPFKKEDLLTKIRENLDSGMQNRDTIAVPE